MPARVKRDAAAGAALALLLGVSAFIGSRGLHTGANFDEGSYTVALEALRSGQKLGEEVFVVQPPLFYRLLEIVGSIFGTAFSELRVGMLIVSLAGLGAAYALGRLLAGPWAGLGAAALLAITPPWPATAPLIEADPPSVTFALVALSLAVAGYGPRGRSSLALVAGIALAGSVLVKLFAVTAFLPLVGLAIALRATRRQLGATAAGGVLVLTLTVLAHVHALPELWDSVFGGHLEQRAIEAPSHLDNAVRVLDSIDPRNPNAYLVVLGLAAYAWRRPRGIWPLWTWTLASIAFTIAMRPLLDHHLVLLAAGTAVPAGASLGAAVATLPRWARAAAAAGVVLVVGVGLAQQLRQVDRNVHAEPPKVLWAASVIERETASGDLIVTDLPNVAVLADRRVPGYLVDVSWGRVQSGALNAANVLSTIEESGIDAVVVGRMLRVVPGLAPALREGFPRRRSFDGVTIYLR